MDSTQRGILRNISSKSLLNPFSGFELNKKVKLNDSVTRPTTSTISSIISSKCTSARILNISIVGTILITAEEKSIMREGAVPEIENILILSQVLKMK